ncbi:thiol reductant ABC exporter subunit CydD [Alkalibacillus aidingensis]|uniref:thiol reductant ABC exporter subunit CydD n=1 Tax=Alkalibacillus aidingensis TaxID=2747607 RepID=UPI0016608521|nr:thiol reductant ABC exporter subunit CydD [Alkalibacillus aidingensis]
MSLLKDLVKQQRQKLMILTIISVMLAATIVVQAYLIVQIIYEIFLNNATFHSILPHLGFLAFVMLLRTLTNHINGRIGIQMTTQAKRVFRVKILDHLSKQPLERSTQGQSGKKVSMILDVVEEVDGYFSQYLPKNIQALTIPLVLLIVIFTQNVTSGLIILITAPFIPLFMALIGIKTKKKSEEQLNELSAFSGQFLDSLKGLTTLKLFGRAENEVGKIEASSIRFREATMGVLAVAFTSSFMMELISMLSVGLIALELSLGLIIFENIAFTTAFFILLLAPEFFVALKDLSSAFHTGRESMTAAKKIEEVLAEPTEQITWGNQSIESLPPSITLEEVSFYYDEDHPTLQNLNATIEANSHVAIVGKSGAGKTTLLNIFTRMLPVHTGQLFISGTPQNQLNEDEWFKHVSYITQHPYIFAGTIYDNIAMGKNRHVTKEEVMQAAKWSGLTDLILSLEEGIDTLVGEGGRGLSGGEKQRLALARAFIKKPSLILFDEPTTGLDLKTEQTLKQSINELAKNATMITVAHRLHTIKQADQILLLDQGQLLAKGTHEELLKKEPTYRELVGVNQKTGGMRHE